MTVKGSPPAQRYFVAGDESDLTVLNVADPPLSVAARDVLRDEASSHPEYLLAAQKGGTFVLEKNVRVAPDGVFVVGPKVADLGQIVEHIAYDGVVEIKRFVRTGGSVARAALWAAAGYFGGGMAGGLVGGALSCAVGGCGPTSPNIPTSVFPGLFAGVVVGTIWGGLHGYRSARHTTEELIYRAP